MISKVFTGLVQLVITMLVARFSSLGEYGTYTQSLLVINLTSSIVMLGLPNCISFFLGRYKNANERREFLSAYFLLNTILSSFCGVLLVCFMGPIAAYFKNEGIRSLWFVFAFYPWAYITSSCIENLTVASGKTHLLIPFKIAHSVLALGAVCFSFFLNIPFIWYLVIFLSIECLFALITYIVALKISGGFTVAIKKATIISIFSFSLPIGLASAVGVLNSEIDKFLIGFMLNPDEVAIYTNVAKDLPIILIPTSITTALLPRISSLFKSNDVKGADELWKRSITVSYFFVSVFAFGCCAFAEDVISFLYGSKYLAGVPIFRVFCVLLLFRCTYWAVLLNASGKTKFIFFSSLISLILNIILNFPFFYFFGTLGCAISTLLSSVAISFVQLFFSSRTLKIRMSHIFPWKNVVVITLANLSLFVFFVRLKEILTIDLVLGSFGESLLLGVVWSLLMLVFFLFFIYKKTNLIMINKK